MAVLQRFFLLMMIYHHQYLRAHDELVNFSDDYINRDVYRQKNTCLQPICITGYLFCC